LVLAPSKVNVRSTLHSSKLLRRDKSRGCGPQSSNGGELRSAGIVPQISVEVQYVGCKLKEFDPDIPVKKLGHKSSTSCG